MNSSSEQTVKNSETLEEGFETDAHIKIIQSCQKKEVFHIDIDKQMDKPNMFYRNILYINSKIRTT